MLDTLHYSDGKQISPNWQPKWLRNFRSPGTGTGTVESGDDEVRRLATENL